jgi:hypothetical protein
MGLHLTHRDVEMANLYSRDALSRLKGYGASGGTAEKAVKGLAKAFEVSLGAGLVGFLSGKFGSADLHVGGKAIPLDLLGGLAGLGVAISMDNETAGEHLSNFSVGVLAGFWTKYGVGVGKAWGEGKLGLPKMPAVSGVVNMLTSNKQSPSPLNEAELAKMAQAIR